MFSLVLITYSLSVSHPFLGDYVRLRQNVQWKKICIENNDQYVVFADIINKIARSSGKVISTDFDSIILYCAKLIDFFLFFLLNSLFQSCWYYRRLQCYCWINELSK